MRNRYEPPTDPAAWELHQTQSTGDPYRNSPAVTRPVPVMAEEQPGATRSAGLRRLSRLTWRATQLSAVTAVGFVTLFVRTGAGPDSRPARRGPRHQAVYLRVAGRNADAFGQPAASQRRPGRPWRAAHCAGRPGRDARRRPPVRLREFPEHLELVEFHGRVGFARLLFVTHAGPAQLGSGARAAARLRSRPAADHLQRIARRRLMPAAAPTMGSRTFRALGSFATLLVTDPDALEPAHELLAAELAAVDAACSRFRADAELSRINHAWGRPVPVSPLFADALSVALAAAELTDGDVDPTCGQSLARLGYDRDFASARQGSGRLRWPPVPAGGWRRVKLDLGRREVTVPADVMLDLGATAKALAATGQRPPSRRLSAAASWSTWAATSGWRVTRPTAAGRSGSPTTFCFDASTAGTESRQVVVIRDGGLATSSTSVRAWRRGGVDLHHIVVPATGRPADSCWRAVSVAAASCVGANVASTASIVRGERAVPWLDGLRLPARLVRRDGSTVTVGGWPADAQGGEHQK